MKRKIFSLVLIVAFAIPCLFGLSGCKKTPPTVESWDGTIAEVSAAQDDIIMIDTAEELAGFAKSVNDGDSYEGITVKLACDMDMKNLEWTPIGYGRARDLNKDSERDLDEGRAFDGIFDGQNKTIKNLNVVGKYTDANDSREVVDDGSSCGVGLFGLVFGSIKNLKIDTAVVSGNHYVGALVGYISNFSASETYAGSIENCHVTNATIHCTYKNSDNGGDKAGALVGYLDQTSISNCSVKNCSVDAVRDAGQMIGGVAHTDVTNFAEIAETNTATNVTVVCNIDEPTGNQGSNIREDELVGRV